MSQSDLHTFSLDEKARMWCYIRAQCAILLTANGQRPTANGQRPTANGSTPNGRNPSSPWMLVRRKHRHGGGMSSASSRRALKILKWIGISLGALLVVLIVVLSLLDWNALRGPIARMASSKLH